MRREEPGSNIVFFPITIGPNLEAVYQGRRQLEYYRMDIKSVKYMQHYSKCISGRIVTAYLLALAAIPGFRQSMLGS